MDDSTEWVVAPCEQQGVTKNAIDGAILIVSTVDTKHIDTVTTTKKPVKQHILMLSYLMVLSFPEDHYNPAVQPQ